MTVCIAAMCDNGENIVCAADRMITIGGVLQLEPQHSKIKPIGENALTMYAGDSEVDAAIKDRLDETLNEVEIEKLTVKGIVRLLLRVFTEERLARAEVSILSKQGLNNDTFLSRQNEMAPTFIEKILKARSNYKMPTVETIVAGHDAAGGHIYIIRNGEIRPQTYLDFASTGGVGSTYSDAYLIRAHHLIQNDMIDTFLNVYWAKKMAEIAIDVGKATDMYILNKTRGATKIPDAIIRCAEGIYQESNRAARECVDKIKGTLSATTSNFWNDK